MTSNNQEEEMFSMLDPREWQNMHQLASFVRSSDDFFAVNPFDPFHSTQTLMNQNGDFGDGNEAYAGYYPQEGLLGITPAPPLGYQMPMPADTSTSPAGSAVPPVLNPGPFNSYGLALPNTVDPQDLFSTPEVYGGIDMESSGWPAMDDSSDPQTTQTPLSPTIDQELFGESPPLPQTDHFTPVYSTPEPPHELPCARTHQSLPGSAQPVLNLPTPASTVASPSCQLILPQPAAGPSPAWSQPNERTPRPHTVQSSQSAAPRGVKRPLTPDDTNDHVPADFTSRIKKPKINQPLRTQEEHNLQKHCDSAGIQMNGLICQSREQFNRMYEMTEKFYRKPLECCTDPSNDDTFPSTDEHYRRYVHQLKDAIMCWDAFIEWRQTLDRKTRNQKTNLQVALVEDHEARKKQGLPVHENALTIRDLLPNSEDYSMYLKNVAQLHTHVLGRVCNDWCAESFAWQLLEAAMNAQQGIAMSMPWTTNDGCWEAYKNLEDRIATIAFVLRNSKQLLKSVMSVGNGWVQRVANNPSSELNGKVDNMRCNLKKNRNVKEANQKNRENTEG